MFGAADDIYDGVDVFDGDHCRGAHIGQMFGYAGFDVADYLVRVVAVAECRAQLLKVGLQQVVCVFIDVEEASVDVD